MLSTINTFPITLKVQEIIILHSQTPYFITTAWLASALLHQVGNERTGWVSQAHLKQSELRKLNVNVKGRRDIHNSSCYSVVCLHQVFLQFLCMSEDAWQISGEYSDNDVKSNHSVHLQPPRTLLFRLRLQTHCSVCFSPSSQWYHETFTHYLTIQEGPRRSFTAGP